MQKNKNPAGLAARRAALQMCDGVLRRTDTLDQAAKFALKAISSPADRALARAIATEVMRWLVDLDRLIDSATRSRLGDDVKARAVLRLMLAQALRLETPPHAVIATGLPLLSGGPRRLAHGVFSALMRKQVTLPKVPTLPVGVRARWGERSAEIAAGLAHPPPLDLSLRDFSETELWAQKLGGVSLMAGHVRLPRGTAVEELPGFDEGAWWVQDLAASLPARLLGAGEGKRVLDLCAAPGGKTLQLAAAGWQVCALDISEARLARLHQNLTRTGLAAEVIVADALKWKADQAFDAILLDAPCSATGTCRRHPDVLHRITPAHIAQMAGVQQALLTRAQGWLKPGGRLVYVVCSMEKEEGEAVAGEVTLCGDPIGKDELPGFSPCKEGWLRTDPAMLASKGGVDGFFMARWRR